MATSCVSFYSVNNVDGLMKLNAKKCIRLIAALLLTGSTLILSACNQKNSDQTEIQEKNKSAAQPSPRDVQTKEEQLESKPRLTTIDTEGALAVEPYELEGIEVALMRVKRASGDTLNVYWTMINQSSEEKTLISCSTAWYCPYKLAAGTFGNGTYIIDSKNRKKHLVVTADKKPIVSTFKTPLKISPNSSINVWAKFPAPPSDVSKISVYIPGVAPMEDITITD